MLNQKNDEKMKEILFEVNLPKNVVDYVIENKFYQFVNTSIVSVANAKGGYDIIMSVGENCDEELIRNSVLGAALIWCYLK